jgi:hypothetical protein
MERTLRCSKKNTIFWRPLMNWNEMFDANSSPSFEAIRDYIGEGAPIWDELLSYLEETYKVKPKIEYSKCSGQPGWNVKYKKSSKSLCTLYPMPNYFIALVVVGRKEENEVELAIKANALTSYVSELYSNTAPSAIGRWLMIDVKNKDILEDVKKLIGIRVK